MRLPHVRLGYCNSSATPFKTHNPAFSRLITPALPLRGGAWAPRRPAVVLPRVVGRPPAAVRTGPPRSAGDPPERRRGGTRDTPVSATGSSDAVRSCGVLPPALPDAVASTAVDARPDPRTHRRRGAAACGALFCWTGAPPGEATPPYYPCRWRRKRVCCRVCTPRQL